MEKKLSYFIIILAFALRLYGINWDQGAHLHPDERALIMVADKIHFWDSLNPDFFNYGSLPIYILKGTAQFLDTSMGTHLANYEGLLYTGRFLSLIFDMGTLIILFKTAKLLFKKPEIANLSIFLYAISFFPIQNTHFFVVDVFLNFFITLTLYILLLYTKKPNFPKIILLSLAYAGALASKITAVVFLPLIVTSLFLLYWVSSDKDFPLPRKLLLSFLSVIMFVVSCILFHFIFMPYAYITYTKFFTDVTLQTQMSRDPYIFPYTLQYVYTTPYFYYLKNIILWGLGPFISFISFIGMVYAFRKAKSQFTQNHMLRSSLIQRLLRYTRDHKIYVVFFLFHLLYFSVVGYTAVKFMRYMLPMYPFFVILAGYGLFQLKKNSQKVSIAILVLAVIWTLSFLHIYSVEHTRTAATKWILQNIPPHSNLAVEHWDDRIPIFSGENYNTVEMTLYDFPDNDSKWQILSDKLNQAEYLIIASNRLYTPLSKLADCSRYKKCYPMTTEYYKKLFSGTLGFQKIAEFSADPKVPFLPLSFSDQSADESFTVYDHPKVMIFKKINSAPKE